MSDASVPSSTRTSRPGADVDAQLEALIQGTITVRPAFIEVYMENNQLFYRPVGEEKIDGVLLYSN